MSRTSLYSKSTFWVVILLAVVGAPAQVFQGPSTYEQVVDASHSGARSAAGLRSRVAVEPIWPDPLLNSDPAPAFEGEQVSLGRLLHAPPEKALRQMKRAKEAFAKGNTEGGVKRLEHAIEIHPDFIEARNNLGVQFARMGRWSDALEQFERAAELDPAAPLPHLNLSMALQAIGDADAAVANAEEAIRLAPQDPGTHYNLGAILAQQGRRLPEAVRHLGRAEASFPRAKLVKAEALLQQSKLAAAQAALRSYLASQPGQTVR